MERMPIAEPDFDLDVQVVALGGIEPHSPTGIGESCNCETEGEYTCPSADGGTCQDSCPDCEFSADFGYSCPERNTCPYTNCC